VEASSTINQPHPDDTGTDAPNPDDFFDPAPAEPEPGDPAASGGTAAAAPEAEAQPEPAPEAQPATAEEVAAQPEATATAPAATPTPEQAAEAAAETQGGEPTATGDGEPANGAAANGGAANGGADAQGGGEESSSGTPSRNYVILRELTLTPEVLEKLLDEAKETNAGSYRVAYFELDVIDARNVKHALGAAFNAHNERIGQKPRLAAVPQRAWSVKTVAPKQRTVESLDIS
jgi:hypothetical protein